MDNETEMPGAVGVASDPAATDPAAPTLTADQRIENIESVLSALADNVQEIRTRVFGQNG